MKSAFIKCGIVTLIILTSLTDCKKDVVNNPNSNTKFETDLEQFEAVWNGLNTAYVFWSVDSTDWDAVYKNYYPIFEEMDTKPNSVWEATWRELTSTLIDHHMKITLKRPSQLYSIIIEPGRDEQKKRSYYHSRPNSFPNVHRQMLNKWVTDGKLSDTVTVYDFNTTYNGNCWCSYSGMIDNDIAFLYLSGFEMNNASAFGKMQAFEHFKEMVVKDNIKAAIIDIRDNPGGNPTDVSYLLSCFTTESRIQVGCSQTKLGLGRYDLTPKMPCYVSDSTGQKKDIPVIILADINSVSAAETAVMAIRHLPQGYMVGERTFGANGVLENHFELFYSGTFNPGEYNQIVTAKFLFSDIDGTCYEGRGIEPDLECLFDQAAWNSGIDNQLECAVEFAKKKIAENEN